MTRKQARRRKPQKARRIRRPKLPRRALARTATMLAAIGVLAATYQLSATVLDRPIRSLQISGPFQRVSALQIEEAVNSELDRGFVSANLTAIQQQVVALPWIDHASVARRWPSKIVISVTEQVPAACWGERGLLNTRGELFVSNASHVPAELPRLSGPEDQSALVAQRYLAIRDRLIPLGLDVRRLHLDARGSWDMTLQNGIDVRLGRKDIDERTQLFLEVAANMVSSQEADIEFVDMRYSNGFTIGWKKGAQSPLDQPQGVSQELVADRLR